MRIPGIRCAGQGVGTVELDASTGLGAEGCGLRGEDTLRAERGCHPEFLALGWGRGDDMLRAQRGSDKPGSFGCRVRVEDKPGRLGVRGRD